MTNDRRQFRLNSELVGSYTKPAWLCDHDKAARRDVSFWRIPEDHLVEAQDDTVLLAISDQERAGLDLITDGEARRQSFSAYFFRMGGIDNNAVVNFSRSWERPGSSYNDRTDPASNTGMITTAPTVTGPIVWEKPLSVNDFAFLKNRTAGKTKVTVIGPATMASRLKDEYYGDFGKLIMDVAAALNQEVLALQAAGADLIQIDDPDLHMGINRVESYAVDALNRTVQGVTTPTAVHVCYGYARTIASKRVDPDYARTLELIARSNVDEMSIEYEQPGHSPELLEATGDKGVILGLLNLSMTAPVESVEHIVSRARTAIEVIGADRLRLAPDCGMWFLPREQAYRKISALATAARALQEDLG
jgi:5-methyltetrahydropteroyltriglutamate--homocysteine methyltransferase